MIHDPLVTATAEGSKQGGCALCKSIVGPFLNTRVDSFDFGRVSICAHTCAPQLARAAGFVDPDVHAAFVADLEELGGKIVELNALVEAERADKVIPLADVIDFLEEREKRRPDAKPAGVGA